MRGIRKKRKKGAQKKGGENSPISPPLDPRLKSRGWPLNRGRTVAVDRRVDPQTTLKFIVNNRTDALKTDIGLFVFCDNKLSNFPLSLVDVSHKIINSCPCPHIVYNNLPMHESANCSYRNVCI